MQFDLVSPSMECVVFDERVDGFLSHGHILCKSLRYASSAYELIWSYFMNMKFSSKKSLFTCHDDHYQLHNLILGLDLYVYW